MTKRDGYAVLKMLYLKDVRRKTGNGCTGNPRCRQVLSEFTASCESLGGRVNPRITGEGAAVRCWSSRVEKICR
jgi:hypothetical protein